MPRQRTARLARLGTAVRPRGSSARSAGVLARRLAVALLVVASLVLLTVYLREDDEGPLHATQRIGLAILAPLQEAGERVARPFQDAYGYVEGLVDAEEERAELERRIEELRQQVVQGQTAERENERLRALLDLVEGSRFPDDFTGLATRVVGQPAGPFSQEITVAAGGDDGVELDAPVVTGGGLVGIVTGVSDGLSQVTLLTDQSVAVSAIDVGSGARGIVRPGRSVGSGLLLDRVEKDQVVEEGDTVITAGWRSGELSSLYPYGIPIGLVSSVGQQDIDLYKRIQVSPFVDFDSLTEVIVLLPR